MERLFTLIVLKDYIVKQKITCFDREKLKLLIDDKRLVSYIDKAIYYGKEKAYLGDGVYTLCYNYWYL